MIYTPRIRAEVHSIPVPLDFRMEIMEYDLEPRFVGLRFFESQWAYFTDAERYKCLVYMIKVRDLLTKYGIPVTLEPVIDTGETLPEEFRRAYG